jgi:hypothetical protein
VIELSRARKTAEIASKKPFDVLAEGLLSEKSRGDKTPLELFLAGVRVWEAGLCRVIVGHHGSLRSAQRSILALGGLTNLHPPSVISRLTF